MNHREAIVFAGPSLAGSTEPLPHGVALRPPACCGDLVRALAETPRAIGLIDGVFETAPSVWHKEILHVMAFGVPVCGAASLGALRAAELHTLGMVGIGAVFEAYRAGTVQRDAAVMVQHAPTELGWAPLTLALVDAEAVIDAASFHPTVRDEMRTHARRLNFRDRTWTTILRLFAQASGERAAEAAARSIASTDFSQKQRDAEALLRLIATPAPPGATPPPPPRTDYLARMLAASESEAGDAQAAS